jgi:hypothetical protein
MTGTGKGRFQPTLLPTIPAITTGVAPSRQPGLFR